MVGLCCAFGPAERATRPERPSPMPGGWSWVGGIPSPCRADCFVQRWRPGAEAKCWVQQPAKDEGIGPSRPAACGGARSVGACSKGGRSYKNLPALSP